MRYYQSPTSTAKEVNISGVLDNDRMFTIARLNPRTSYMIEVMAVNEENQLGPSADINVATTIPQGKELYDFVTTHMSIHNF